jgi:hypothetical protein
MRDDKNKVDYETYKDTADGVWKCVEWKLGNKAFFGGKARNFNGLKFDAWENAPFGYPDEELVPIIFVHGLTAHGAQSFGWASEMASHGYLVMNVDCICGAGAYTELEDGSKIWFNSDLPFPKDYRQDFVKAYKPYYERRLA